MADYTTYVWANAHKSLHRIREPEMINFFFRAKIANMPSFKVEYVE